MYSNFTCINVRVYYCRNNRILFFVIDFDPAFPPENSNTTACFKNEDLEGYYGRIKNRRKTKEYGLMSIKQHLKLDAQPRVLDADNVRSARSEFQKNFALKTA